MRATFVRKRKKKKGRLGQLLIALACLLVGALGTNQIRTSATGSAWSSWVQPRSPDRQLVESRSQHIELAQLQALGYVDGSYDADSQQTGVVHYEPAKASPGYNFYASRKQNGAQLIDMQGNTVHAWQATKPGNWAHAELLPDGDVVVIVKDERLSLYDAGSNRVWSVEGRFHHDLWVHGDEIYVLSRAARVVDFVHPKVKTLVDFIEVRSLETGELERRIGVLDAIRDSAYRFLLPSVSHVDDDRIGTQLDVLHPNHVEVLDGRLAELSPIYSAGNILVSLRNINAVVILDGETGKIDWIWGPTNLTFQHDPTLLDDGHLLIFDNGSERSRVVELDPLSQEVVWQYGPSDDFFSRTRGSNQRLPNGDTLVTESDTGYVFEVTPAGRIVWRFANPDVNSHGERRAIWRMTRVDPESLTFLGQGSVARASGRSDSDESAASLETTRS